MDEEKIEKSIHVQLMLQTMFMQMRLHVQRLFKKKIIEKWRRRRETEENNRRFQAQIWRKIIIKILT